MDHTHVFITGTTNSGTGLLRHLMASSDQLSVMMKEGHHYSKILPRDRGPATRRMFALYPKKFHWGPGKLAPDQQQLLKEHFYRHWDRNKPFLVEKSPHHMLRTRFMAQVFDPAKFVVITRSPFAVCEGLRRRRGHDIGRCAEQWKEAHRILWDDMKHVDTLTVSYEEMTQDPDSTLGKIGLFLGVTFPPVDQSTPIRRQNMFGNQYALASAPDFNEESLKRLSKLDRRTIWNVVGDEASKWGYANSR
jgi:hypothetical protein